MKARLMKTDEDQSQKTRPMKTRLVNTRLMKKRVVKTDENQTDEDQTDEDATEEDQTARTAVQFYSTTLPVSIAALGMWCTLITSSTTHYNKYKWKHRTYTHKHTHKPTISDTQIHSDTPTHM